MWEQILGGASNTTGVLLLVPFRVISWIVFAETLTGTIHEITRTNTKS